MEANEYRSVDEIRASDKNFEIADILQAYYIS